MNSVTNPYDSLYTNLKNRFTVIYDGAECTVGDFMLMKAGKTASKSNLPVAAGYDHHSLAGIVEYVNDKLTVKNPPAKNKTIKRFPLRTSVSALLSSVAACALVLSCGIFALSGKPALSPFAENTDVGEYIEEYTDINNDELPTAEYNK